MIHGRKKKEADVIKLISREFFTTIGALIIYFGSIGIRMTQAHALLTVLIAAFITALVAFVFINLAAMGRAGSPYNERIVYAPDWAIETEKIYGALLAAACVIVMTFAVALSIEAWITSQFLSYIMGLFLVRSPSSMPCFRASPVSYIAR